LDGLFTVFRLESRILSPFLEEVIAGFTKIGYDWGGLKIARVQ
jgi:hypothetical protein